MILILFICVLCATFIWLLVKLIKYHFVYRLDISSVILYYMVVHDVYSTLLSVRVMYHRWFPLLYNVVSLFHYRNVYKLNFTFEYFRSNVQSSSSSLQSVLCRWLPLRKTETVGIITTEQSKMAVPVTTTENKKTTLARLEPVELHPLELQIGGATDLERGLLLDDAHLEKLLCSECGKYLSVLPVKLYQNGAVKCGRCCKLNESDGGTVSLYENLVKNCLFKCVNRYEQCTKLLTVPEVSEHELQCFSGRYDCPKCEQSKFSGSAYELLRHFRNKHASSILQKNKFYVQIKGVSYSKERYLFLKNDIIFFILTENLPYEENLYLSVVSLTPHKNIKQQFVLKLKGETVEQIITETKCCTSLKTFKCDYFNIKTNDCSGLEKIKCEIRINLSENANKTYEIPMLFKKPEEKPVASRGSQTTSLEDITGVQLTEDFKREYPYYKLTPCGTALFKLRIGTRIELTCSECKHFTGSNVFSCENNEHVMCWECKTKKCKCNLPVDSWNADISSINELLLLPCRWNCGETFSGDKLRNHEEGCTFRELRYPYRRIYKYYPRHGPPGYRPRPRLVKTVN